MKTIKSLFIVTILCLSTAALATEGYVFKVLANKGVSQVKSGSEINWKLVKTGAVLVNGDELNVQENSYIGLVHSSGRTLELTTPGSVNINELATQLEVEGTSVTSKYADFVLTQLSKVENDRRNQLHVTGAVDRNLSSPTMIDLQMPLSGEIFGSDALIQWNAIEGANSYKVTVKNLFDEEILNQVTAGNNIQIDFNQPELVNERLLILNVSVEGNGTVESGEYGIKRMSEQDHNQIESKVSELGHTNSTSSLAEVMKASLYEQNNLLIDAASSYRRAIELSPEVKDFQKMYDAFMDRNNLK